MLILLKLTDPSSAAVGGGTRDSQLASRLRVTEQRLAEANKTITALKAQYERAQNDLKVCLTQIYLFLICILSIQIPTS